MTNEDVREAFSRIPGATVAEEGARVVVTLPPPSSGNPGVVELVLAFIVGPWGALAIVGGFQAFSLPVGGAPVGLWLIAIGAAILVGVGRLLELVTCRLKPSRSAHRCVGSRRIGDDPASHTTGEGASTSTSTSGEGASTSGEGASTSGEGASTSGEGASTSGEGASTRPDRGVYQKRRGGGSTGVGGGGGGGPATTGGAASRNS